MLLDLQALKGCLLRMPGTEQSESQSTSYGRAITQSTTGLETLLKIIIAPVVRVVSRLDKMTIAEL